MSYVTDEDGRKTLTCDCPKCHRFYDPPTHTGGSGYLRGHAAKHDGWVLDVLNGVYKDFCSSDCWRGNCTHKPLVSRIQIPRFR